MLPLVSFFQVGYEEGCKNQDEHYISSKPIDIHFLFPFFLLLLFSLLLLTKMIPIIRITIERIVTIQNIIGSLISAVLILSYLFFLVFTIPMQRYEFSGKLPNIPVLIFLCQQVKERGLGFFVKQGRRSRPPATLLLVSLYWVS